jgi:hypothetical protein
LKGLGNAVVPAVAAVVGRALAAQRVLPANLWLYDKRGRPAKELPLLAETKLPRAGVAVDGVVVALPEAAPSSRRLPCLLPELPTPTARDYGSNKGGRVEGRERLSLQSLARQGKIPTPAARLGDPKRGMPTEEQAQKRWAEGKRNLDDAVRLGQVPTPTAQSGVRPRPYQQRRRADGGFDIYPTLEGLAAADARQAEMALHVASGTVPTPTASDHKGGPRVGGRYDKQLRFAVGGSLSPLFVEWLLGFPLDWSDVDVG